MLAAFCGSHLTMLGQFETMVEWNAWPFASRTDLLILGIGASLTDDELSMISFIAGQGTKAISLKMLENCPGVKSFEQANGISDLKKSLEATRNKVFSVQESKTRYGSSTTDKEWEMMLYVSQGMSNEQIAAAMDLNLQTIKNNLSSIMKRAQCRNRVELALKVREGRIHLSEQDLSLPRY